MTSTATNNPFAGIVFHSRTLGRGKKAKVEAWVTLDASHQWRNARFAVIRGVGADLDAAGLDWMRQAAELLQELGIIACTAGVVTVTTDATASNTTAGILRLRF